MGMDYKYSGSASYGRFDKELCAVAEIFGAVKTDNLKTRETDVARFNSKHNMFYNVFGTYSILKADELKFLFPKVLSVLTKCLSFYPDFQCSA